MNIAPKLVRIQKLNIINLLQKVEKCNMLKISLYFPTKSFYNGSIDNDQQVAS